MRSVSATGASQRCRYGLYSERGVLLLQDDGLRALNIAEFQRFCDRIGAQAEARSLDEEKLAGLLADKE